MWKKAGCESVYDINEYVKGEVTLWYIEAYLEEDIDPPAFDMAPRFMKFKPVREIPD